MITHANHNNILEKVVSIYVKCQITSFPLDCFSVLKTCGFRVYTYEELKKQNLRLYQMCIAYSSDSFRFENMIAYNEKNNYFRIRFSLMHELGHVVLEHEKDAPEHEEDADYFASNFLAPRILIHTGGYRTSDAIHDAFGLSYTASNRALLAYKEWFWIISHSRPRCPSPPEKQLELIFFPEEVPDQTAIGEEDSCSEQSSYCGYRGFSGLSDQQQWYYAKGL